MAVMSHPEIEIPLEPTATHSIFPLENHELSNSRWEDDIIWNSEAMNKIPGYNNLLFFS